MVTTYKIHPAIGIARVGNSPDEFFIGPERVGERPDPPGGFKDADCRVKRQAARFRIFAYHDDETVEEVTADVADITWSVHVANKKAPFPGRGNAEPEADITIDPGLRSLSTPNSIETLDGGTITFSGQNPVEVPLGEMRTDDDGRLLVLGGSGDADTPVGVPVLFFWGNAGWYDDIADGPVTATVTLHEDGSTHDADGAWVIVAPPKFAPDQDSVTTLYDRLTQTMVESALLTEPTTTSYTNDVYPILKRAHDMAWVEGLTAYHQWPHPVTDQTQIDAIMSRVIDPATGGRDMPDLNENTDDQNLTLIQYAHLARWQAGNYTNDWTGVPEPEADITPEGLDRAALEACVGGAFYPGIEAGGRDDGERPILEVTYSEAFRIDHDFTGPGDISASMALPWQADFNACGENWWPVPRPNDVFVNPGDPSLKWDRTIGSHQDMVDNWATLGFVVRQGAEHLETDRCDTSSVQLLTPYLNFLDVPEGPMGTVRELPLAITFEVISEASAVTLEYAPGGAPSHAQLIPVANSVTVGPTAPNGVATARLWLIYQTGAAGSDIPTQVLTVQDPATGRTWDVTVDANTVGRQTTAVGLALDRSGSMSGDRGDGQSKHDSLQEAANLFVEMMLEGDGCGIARFNQDAQELSPVLTLGNGLISDLNRTAIRDVIDGDGLDPSGGTSIGDGIHEARTLLDNAADPYDRDALVVLTDGIENQPQWIADVAADIDARTYAIGFGPPENISVAALQTISGNSGGYTLITGAITGDNRYRLQKQFLQILAGINNAEVVLDPDGEMVPGQVVKVPFRITDADNAIEVVLLTPRPSAVDFRLLSPLGQLIEPWQALSEPTMHYSTADQAAFYRIALPIRVGDDGRFDQAGTWHAVFRLGKPRIDKPDGGPDIDILRRRPRGKVRSKRRASNETERRFDLIQSHAAGDAADSVARGHGTGATVGSQSSRRQPAVPYSVVVHAYSSTTLQASVEQDGYRPGSMVNVRAKVLQSGLAARAATVWAEITGPDGETSTYDLARDQDGEGGRYQARFPVREAGVHRIRVRANGTTRSGYRFSREQSLSAQVWHGADRPGDRASDPRPPTGGRGDGGGDGGGEGGGDAGRDLGRLLWCIFGREGAIDDKLWKRWANKGLKVERLWDCLERYAKGKTS